MQRTNGDYRPNETLPSRLTNDMLGVGSSRKQPEALIDRFWDVAALP